MDRIERILRRWRCPDSLSLLLFGKVKEEKPYPVAVMRNSVSKEKKETQENKENARPRQYSYSELEQIMREWATVPAHSCLDYNMEMLAEACQIPYPVIRTYFNDYKNVSFRTWHLEMKLETAKQLLLDNEALRVAEVGAKAGFGNRSNFYRQFKRYVGCTPYQWRSCHGCLQLLAEEDK